MTRTAFVRRLAWLEHQQRPQVPAPDALTLLTLAGIQPDPWQRQVLTSAAPRVLLNCCRQSGKSTTAAALALATALHEPGALTLVLSPTLRQSQELFRKVLDLYRPAAGSLPASQASALRLELGHGARILSLPGTESTTRGYSGVTLLVVDEASRVSDDLYYAIRPMLAVSGGRLLALSTPWGKRGWFYKERTQGEYWVQVRIPATECPRISSAFLEEERRSLPALWYASEYACVFGDTAQSLFRADDIDAMFAQDAEPWFPGGI
jgi:hypothetical protein